MKKNKLLNAEGNEEEDAYSSFLKIKTANKQANNSQRSTPKLSPSNRSFLGHRPREPRNWLDLEPVLAKRKSSSSSNRSNSRSKDNSSITNKDSRGEKSYISTKQDQSTSRTLVT